jgi:hypothetical protein
MCWRPVGVLCDSVSSSKAPEIKEPCFASGNDRHRVTCISTDSPRKLRRANSRHAQCFMSVQNTESVLLSTKAAEPFAIARESATTARPWAASLRWSRERAYDRQSVSTATSLEKTFAGRARLVVCASTGAAESRLTVPAPPEQRRHPLQSVALARTIWPWGASCQLDWQSAFEVPSSTADRSLLHPT